MKFVLILFSILSSISTLFAQKTVDKVVAQVGDHVILLSDIEGQKAAIRQQGATPTKEDECIILESLLYENLLVNQAELDSVVISDEQVDAEMENRIRSIEAQMAKTKDENGETITFEKFYGKSKSQVKEEFRATIKKRLQGQEIERGITSDAEVSPREVEEFYNSIPKDSLPFINSKIGFQQISIFPTITEADKKRAKQELEDCVKDVKSGRISFETAARRCSDDPGSAQQGGLIEATRGMMVKPFEMMAYNLKPGDISEVFETEYGYHVMVLIERKGDDYKCRHILKKFNFSLDSLDAADKRINECYKALTSATITWEDAVVRYSTDENTKQNNGTLMNPITGEQLWSIEDINQVDPSMFQLTNPLNKGQFTQAKLYFDFYQMKEGIRIVRIFERTQPHQANLKDDYDLFRRLAEEKKRNDAIQAWTKSKISTAYIRIDKDFISCDFMNEWIAKQ